ncbi:MAG: hypothetical protein L0Y72_27080 [Gemmataceae bacterium]|nr:hypothetical protein [Gemmataceae bacterium]MCI0742715.1 hypothetical protein [Gemmataceae bacterium]
MRVGTPVSIPVVSPDASLFAHKAVGRSIVLRDFLTGEVKGGVELTTFFPNLVAFAPDGKKLVAASGAGTTQKPSVEVFFWDIATGQLEPSVILQSGQNPLAISRNTKFLVSTKAKDAGVAIAWDIGQRKCMDLPGHTGPVTRVAISDDGKWAVTQGGPGLFVWDLATGNKKWEKYFDDSPLPNRLDFSPDGRLLLLGFSSTVQLYDTKSGKVLGGVRTQGGRFSPDGRWIASPCSKDVWNNNKNGIRIYLVDEVLFPQEGKPKLVLPKVILEATGPDGYFSMTISPDSRYVVTACSRGVIRVWEVPKFDK